PFGDGMRRAVRRHGLRVVGHAELLEYLCRCLHGLPVRRGAHHDADHERPFPVRRFSASLYFSDVFEITSGGSFGAGGVLSQSSGSRSSRTNCLSYEGGDMPTLYESAGQKREESAVSTSSISTNSFFSLRPNSNLVSAMMIPFVAAYS